MRRRDNICPSCAKRPRILGRGYCRECCNSKFKYDPAYEKSRRKKIRDFIDSFKNVPCTDCGNSYPTYVMDFDHVLGDKKFNIASAPDIRIKQKLLFQMIVEEVSKCEIVCSNCHRIRTFTRLYSC